MQEAYCVEEQGIHSHYNISQYDFISHETCLIISYFELIFRENQLLRLLGSVVKERR